MKIRIVTLLFDDVPYFKYSHNLNRRYCSRHGYDLVVAKAPLDIRRCPTWYKVPAVETSLSGVDYVLFLDADAYVHFQDKSIESLIAAHGNGASMVFGTDRQDKHFAWSDTDANTGVFLVRNCRSAYHILDDWWNVPTRFDDAWLWKWPPEQGAFNVHVRQGRYGEHIRVIEYKHINGVDGTFIRHLSGLSDEERLLYFRNIDSDLIDDPCRR